MIKIGITGSLASGKTTVAKIISSKKNPLFDADKSVKRIYQSNTFKSKVFKKFKLKNRSNIKDDLKQIILKNSFITRIHSFCEGQLYFKTMSRADKIYNFKLFI